MNKTAIRDEQIKRLKAQKRKQKLSRVFSMPDLRESSLTLSAAEVEFFKDNGFLIKPGLLEEDEIDRAVRMIWDHLCKALPRTRGATWRLVRDDPRSWLNPQWAPQPPHPVSGPFQGRQPIEHYGRIVKLHDLGGAAHLLDLFPNNSQVRAVAESILDKRLRRSTVTRGVYLVFPTANPADPTGKRRISGASLGPHTDQVCQQLNACAYLQDVAPRNGGFTVYPGSHKVMYRAHQFEANWSPRRSYHRAIARVVETIRPLELTAPGGSVIFWHGRLVHSVGIHTGQSIRWALFADFTQNRARLTDDEHRDVGQYEWFKDAKLFREDYPVGDDMWRHWRLHARP